jgi:hypothetical protein
MNYSTRELDSRGSPSSNRPGAAQGRPFIDTAFRRRIRICAVTKTCANWAARVRQSVAISLEDRTIDIKEGPYQATRDLLLVSVPRTDGEALKSADETSLAAAMRLAPHLNGVFPIQGPPGTGKTHIGARMICTLAQAGKNLGITANSHKVIRNVLDEVLEAAPELGTSVECIQKVSETEPNLPRLQFTTDNSALLGAIGTSCQVAGGTAWLWARADAFQSVDTLFIDEAAQMSLANVLAVSQAAQSIVLLGDPQHRCGAGVDMARQESAAKVRRVLADGDGCVARSTNGPLTQKPKHAAAKHSAWLRAPLQFSKPCRERCTARFARCEA